MYVCGSDKSQILNFLLGGRYPKFCCFLNALYVECMGLIAGIEIR